MVQSTLINSGIAGSAGHQPRPPHHHHRLPPLAEETCEEEAQGEQAGAQGQGSSATSRWSSTTHPPVSPHGLEGGARVRCELCDKMHPQPEAVSVECGSGCGYSCGAAKTESQVGQVAYHCSLACSCPSNTQAAEPRRNTLTLTRRTAAAATLLPTTSTTLIPQPSPPPITPTSGEETQEIVHLPTPPTPSTHSPIHPPQHHLNNTSEDSNKALIDSPSTTPLCTYQDIAQRHHPSSSSSSCPYSSFSAPSSSVPLIPHIIGKTRQEQRQKLLDSSNTDLVSSGRLHNANHPAASPGPPHRAKSHPHPRRPRPPPTTASQSNSKSLSSNHNSHPCLPFLHPQRRATIHNDTSHSSSSSPSHFWPRVMATSVAQSIPITIPRQTNPTNVDINDAGTSKGKSFPVTSSAPAASPTKANAAASLSKMSSSPLSAFIPRAASYNYDTIGSPYTQSSLPRTTPANSILLNSRRNTISSTGPELQDGAPTECFASIPSSALPPAPVVTHIPAVPIDPAALRREKRREREKLREREERERREREIREREMELAMEIEEQEEKVWGIPKKAFYFGLGSVPGAINFNAQMAMMAGWGNGSGGQGDYIRAPNGSLTRPPYKNRSSSGPSKRPSSIKRASSTSSRASASKDKLRRSSTGKDNRPSLSSKGPDGLRSSSSSINVALTGSDESEGDEMDPEELAALNAIINTRRSMAAAQALASGEVKLPAPKRPVRPGLANIRGMSQETIATLPSSTSDVTSPTAAPTDGTGTPDSKPRPPFQRTDSVTSSTTVPDDLATNGSITTSKIRFAPLPRPSPNNTLDDDPLNRPRPSEDGGAVAADALSPSLADGQSSRSITTKDSFESDRYFDRDDDQGFGSGDESESSYEDVDEAEKWRRRMKKYKGKWYLMGLPPQTFKAEYYRSWRKWAAGDAAQQTASPRANSSKSDREDSPVSAEKSLGPEDLKEHRRLSTGSLSLMSSAESARRHVGEAFETPPASPVTMTKPATPSTSESKAAPRRGRRGRAHSQSSQKGSTARSASAGSGVDKEERLRRRQLILAARPGGTGMVTLPDGTKMRARRVDDAAEEGTEISLQEWGFAGLARSQKAGAAEESPQDETVPDVTEGGVEGEEDRPMQRTASPTGILSDATPRSVSPSAHERAISAKLSVQERAEQVRRRHEAEVAALGAEVLAAHRRKVGAATAAANTPAPGTEAGPVSPTASGQSDAPSSAQPSSEVKKETEDTRPRPEAPSAKNTGPTSKSSRPALSTLFHRRQGRSSSPPVKATSPSRSSHSTDSQSPLEGVSRPPAVTSNSKVSLTSVERVGASLDSRLADPSVNLYTPLGSQPRKPDARGYAVVPLPSRLGVRPERPREGRVWEFSDDESSLDCEAPRGQKAAVGNDERGKVKEDEEDENGDVAVDDDDNDDDDEDDEDDDDDDEVTNMEMDAEEMAEEEQRKVAHSKRATTTAAGLERMLVRNRTGSTATSLASASTRGQSTMHRTRTVDGEVSSVLAMEPSSSSSSHGRRVASAGAAPSSTLAMTSSSHPAPQKEESVSSVLVDTTANDEDGGDKEGHVSTLRATRSSPAMPRRKKSCSLSPATSSHRKSSRSRATSGRRPADAGADADAETAALSSSTDDDHLWSRSVPGTLGMGLSLSPTTSRTSQTSSISATGSHATAGAATGAGAPYIYGTLPRQPSSPACQHVRGLPSPSLVGKERRSTGRFPSVDGLRRNSSNKEKEKNKNKEKGSSQERDDDALDYGWPSSLKGSLYDR